MTWIKTVDENEAEGKVKEIYEAFKKQVGFVPSIMKLFSIKPRSMDATCVAAYFNYINRMSDALGIEPEEAFSKKGG